MHNTTQYNDIIAYNESQRRKHKTILKLFVLTLSLINIFELIILFSIKHTKSTLQHENTHIKQMLSHTADKLHNKTNIINNRLVNLHLRTTISRLYLTDIFKSKNELDVLMNEINTKLNINDNINNSRSSNRSISSQLKPTMCYQGKVDGDTPIKYNANCVSNKMLVVIETIKGNRFGAFTANSTCGDANRTYAYRNDINAFLFALNNNNNNNNQSNVMLFNIKHTHQHKAFKLTQNGFFIFGDKDLQVEPHYKNGYSSFSLFPKCYGDSNHKLRNYTNEANEFTIKEMEIYSIL